MDIKKGLKYSKVILIHASSINAMIPVITVIPSLLKKGANTSLFFTLSVCNFSLFSCLWITFLLWISVVNVDIIMFSMCKNGLSVLIRL
ncbi:hypothetical protein B5E73_03745 [Ligilactobacillus salivarius]|nr:hypothetical protein B5E73_03745 [Ligilactobacillus salivarius]